MKLRSRKDWLAMEILKIEIMVNINAHNNLRYNTLDDELKIESLYHLKDIWNELYPNEDYMKLR